MKNLKSWAKKLNLQHKMRYLKLILAFLLSIVFLFILISIFLPKKFEVKRNIIVNADVETTWLQMKNEEHLRRWLEWYQTSENKNDSVLTYKNQNYLLNNFQTAVDSLLMFKLAILESKTIFSHAEFIISREENEKCVVQAKILGKLPFSDRLKGLWMEEKLGNPLEASLNNLKKISEKHFNKKYAFAVAKREEKTQYFLGVKQQIALNEKEFFIKKSIKELNVKGIYGNAPIFMILKQDSLEKFADVLCGYEINENKDAGNFIKIKIPTSKVLKSELKGSIDSLSSVKKTIEEYAGDRDYKLLYPYVEKYSNPFWQNSDTLQWATEVIYRYRRVN